MKKKDKALPNAIKRYIEEFYDKKGYSPTVREIADEVFLRSKPIRWLACQESITAVKSHTRMRPQDFPSSTC